ncbi:MAG: cob(I)yrinic acid a,c-diamide adenosyltransferase [Thermoguttaceae bacterium]
MKIYTKTGDTGETGLPGGGRVPKDATVTEVCGTIDELNTVLGMARAARVPDDVDRLLDRIQSDLFDLGAEVAQLGADGHSPCRIDAADIRALEEAIDQFDAELPTLRNFILPGGTFAAAELHFARAVCRRAERCLVGLMRESPALSSEILVYLNRLSDLLFVLARLVNLRAGRSETIWRRG